MVQNIKTKKILALATIIFFTLSFLPIVQASDGAYKENKNIVTTPLSTEELFASFNQTYGPDKFLPIDDCDIVVDSFPIPDNVPEMTKEEELRNACFPGYFTPDQITLQDISSRNNGQSSRANPQPIKTIIIVDTEAYDKYAAMAIYSGLTPTEAGCFAWANNILEGGDDMMELWFGVDFQAQSTYFRVWDSPNYMNYAQLLNETHAIDPHSVGCDVIVLMTGQSDGLNTGLAYIAV